MHDFIIADDESLQRSESNQVDDPCDLVVGKIEKFRGGLLAHLLDLLRSGCCYQVLVQGVKVGPGKGVFEVVDQNDLQIRNVGSF